MSKLESLHQTLKKEFESGNPNLNVCHKTLGEAKIELIKLGYLSSLNSNDKNALLVARNILELGALLSVRSQDAHSFERYITQLEVFYNDHSQGLPASTYKDTLTGLNLMRLIAQNRISDFHMALEKVDPQEFEKNIFIKYPVEIEQSLMEGSYTKVLDYRGQPPSPEFSFFMDILIITIRNEIASCCEKAYESLPLVDVGAILFLNDKSELMNFCKERRWQISPQDQVISFSGSKSTKAEIPTTKIITQTLGYAKELEKIV